MSAPGVPTALGLTGAASGSAPATHDAAAAPTPAAGGLRDRFGRVAIDLRVSLTDRCNLRCTYCMPAEGLDWTPTEQMLSDAELARLIRISVERLGVREVRFTGGEPLLRKGLESLVAATSALRTPSGEGVPTSLTTNGLGLAHRARALAAAGLRRVNVSVDTLDPGRFARLTRRDRLPEVLAGLEAAEAAGLAPLKVNAVLMRGINDDEAPGLLRWALGRGYELRFIEQMPLGPHGTWVRDDMVTAAEIIDALGAEFALEPEGEAVRAGAPAETWRVLDGGEVVGRVGVIGTVTRPFCRACDRTRLTSDGQVRTCLFSQEETDLRGLLRGGASDDEVAEAWRTAMWGKKAGHGIDDEGFLQPARLMSAIGG